MNSQLEALLEGKDARDILLEGKVNITSKDIEGMFEGDIVGLKKTSSGIEITLKDVDLDFLDDHVSGRVTVNIRNNGSITVSPDSPAAQTYYYTGRIKVKDPKTLEKVWSSKISDWENDEGEPLELRRMGP